MAKLLFVNCKQIEIRCLLCNGRALIGRTFCFVYGETRREKKNNQRFSVKSTDDSKTSKTFNNIVYVSRINNRQFIGTSARTFLSVQPCALSAAGGFPSIVFTFPVERFSNGDTGIPPKHSVFSVCTRVSRRDRRFICFVIVFIQHRALRAPRTWSATTSVRARQTRRPTSITVENVCPRPLYFCLR